MLDDETRDAARELFKKHDGVIDLAELRENFTDAQIFLLSREGCIEVTTQRHIWAWKGR